METQKTNGTYDPTNEKFILVDPRDKKSYLLRDASEEQLQSLLQGLKEEQQLLQNNVNDIFSRLANGTAVIAVATYELERRARSIVIAHKLF